MSSQSFSQLITVNLQYNGIKITKQCSDVNCVKSVCIRSWPGPYYATFCVNMGTYSASLHIQSKCGNKNSHQKKHLNSVMETIRNHSIMKNIRQIQNFRMNTGDLKNSKHNLKYNFPF